MKRFSIEDCSKACSPGRLIRRIDKLMLGWIEERLEQADINFSQWLALKVVRDGSVSNPGELARELGHTTGAVTRLIDGLEQRGLIARDRGSFDRRVVRLVITDEGRAKLAAFAPQVLDAWNDVFEVFDDDEGEQLVEHLERLLAAVERKAGRVVEEDVLA